MRFSKMMSGMPTMRNVSLDMAIIVAVLLVAYIRPVLLVNFFNTNIGRFVLLLGIVTLASYDTLWGILGVLLLVCFRENIAIEGMENINKDPKDFDINKMMAKAGANTGVDAASSSEADADTDADAEAKKWRKANCKANQVMLGDAVVDMDEFSKKFPNVEFTNGKCNPCMDNCKIKVTSGSARLETEDGVRSKPSNTLPVNTA